MKGMGIFGSPFNNMKKIKINEIELEIDDGVEITIDSNSNIKIHSKQINWSWVYPTVTQQPEDSRFPEPYKVTWTSNTSTYLKG